MKFEPGTFYSNSIKPVVATDRVNEHGDTIWRNEGTAGDCIVLRGRLFGAEMAGRMRDFYTADAAFQSRATLRDVMRWHGEAGGLPAHLAAAVRAALARCDGDTEMAPTSDSDKALAIVDGMNDTDLFDYLADHGAEPSRDTPRTREALRAAVLANIREVGHAEFCRRMDDEDGAEREPGENALEQSPETGYFPHDA